MAIKLPKLPFSLNDLEPYISRKTLEFHYGKHHKNYVDTLNKLIAGTPFDRLELEEIMEASDQKKENIYNNAAQVWNHTFYWKCLSANSVRPSNKLETVLSKTFASFDEFKLKFGEEGNELFGSGFVWLTKDPQGKLQIRALSDAENPLQLGETPLLCCDVWEHAYYLDYQNERPKYLKSFWTIVDWEFVENNLDKTLKKTTIEAQKSAGQSRLKQVKLPEIRP